MLTTSDFLHLPYTPDLTPGGIAYAIRSLPYTYDRMGGSPFSRLRRIVAGVAVELAFRRYLSEQEIHFDVKGSTPFTDPDRYDVSLGGHRCDIKSFLISRRQQITSLETRPEQLLKAPALVPSDQHAAGTHRQSDLYVFAFLTGLVAASRIDIEKALEAGQSAYFIHTLPKRWSKPKNWVHLGTLALKSESDQVHTIEIGGQAEGREFLTYSVTLPPRERIQVNQGFFSLSSIQIDRLPQGRVGIHSPALNDTYLIDPFGWGNIWVYGMSIILAGYITYDEFRHRASTIQPGSRVFQYAKTKTKNLAIPVNDLKPLPELLERVRVWSNK